MKPYADLFEHDSYKDAIRARVKEVRSVRKTLTLQKIAALIPVQNTYLSKALNDDRTHLNEDHLFALGRILELTADEADYLGLLRARDMTANAARRDFLQAKIERLRGDRRLSAEAQRFGSADASRELRFLLDPLATVVYVALSIPAYRKQPRALCAALGISPAALKEILGSLAALGFVDSGDEPLSVARVHDRQIHYGREHPLMRVHQGLFKTLAHSQLLRTEERDKHSVLATFAADDATFERIKSEFSAFLKKVEGLAARAPAARAFQLGFDLFRWL